MRCECKRYALMSAIVTVLALVFSACQPTPGYLERWANTPGSDEKFVGYMHNPNVSHEVRVKALELLVDQWQYSRGFFSDGSALRGMPDAGTRDRTIRDALPHLRRRFEADDTRAVARDALYYVRAGTDNAELREEIESILATYIVDMWAPCVDQSGMITVAQLLNVIPPEQTVGKIVSILDEGSLTDVLCMIQFVGPVEWLATRTEVAEAFINRWESGRISEHDQHNVDIFSFMIRFRDLPVMREWYYRAAADTQTPGLYTNMILDLLEQYPQDSDIDGYVRMLSNERYTRWEAFQSLVNRGGSQGLERALSNLPATGEYGYVDGEVRPNGFRLIAEVGVCETARLSELGDNARQVFERHARGDNPHARALSLTCLRRYGDRRTVQTLRTYGEGLGEAPIPVAGYGEGATLQELVAETIQAIEARLES